MTRPVLEAYAEYLVAQDNLRKAMDARVPTVDEGELVRLLRARHRAEARNDSLGLEHGDRPVEHAAQASGSPPPTVHRLRVSHRQIRHYAQFTLI